MLPLWCRTTTFSLDLGVRTCLWTVPERNVIMSAKRTLMNGLLVILMHICAFCCTKASMRVQLSGVADLIEESGTSRVAQHCKLHSCYMIGSCFLQEFANFSNYLSTEFAKYLFPEISYITLQRFVVLSVITALAGQ